LELSVKNVSKVFLSQSTCRYQGNSLFLVNGLVHGAQYVTYTIFGGAKWYTVGVNKMSTFHIRTTIVVRTENLRSVLHNFSVLQLLIQQLSRSQEGFLSTVVSCSDHWGGRFSVPRWVVPII